MGDTKKKLIQSAAKLFSEKGYDKVSIRELAASVGIQESSIYNHFTSKQDILDTVLDEFVKIDETCIFNEVSTTQSIIENAPPEIVLSNFILYYPKEKVAFMTDVLRILVMEQFKNKKARDIFLNNVFNYPKRNIKTILDKLIEYHKIKSTNTEYLSYILAYTNCSALIRSLGFLPTTEKKEETEEDFDYLTFINGFINILVKGIAMNP